jgi:hypothetical protein
VRGRKRPGCKGAVALCWRGRFEPFPDQSVLGCCSMDALFLLRVPETMGFASVVALRAAQGVAGAGGPVQQGSLLCSQSTAAEACSSSGAGARWGPAEMLEPAAVGRRPVHTCSGLRLRAAAKVPPIRTRGWCAAASSVFAAGLCCWATELRCSQHWMLATAPGSGRLQIF